MTNDSRPDDDFGGPEHHGAPGGNASISRQPYVLPGSTPKRWYDNRGLVIGAFAALVLLVMVLGGALLSGGSTYSGNDLEDDVARVIADNGGTASSVSCPETIAVKRGEIVSCSATVDGYRTGVRVTMDDDKGHFTLQLESL